MVALSPLLLALAREQLEEWHKKRLASNTGGLSSNSGTVSPGTNSAWCMRISIVDGA